MTVPDLVVRQRHRITDLERQCEADQWKIAQQQVELDSLKDERDYWRDKFQES